MSDNINNVAGHGQYLTNYYNVTDTVTMSGLFQAHIDASDLTKMQTAFGFALESLKKGEIDTARLEIVGDNAVKYAQQLLEAQLKDPSRKRLSESISSKVVKVGNTQRLEIYATAVNQSGVPYGTFVEYGSHPGGGETYVYPKPFLRPALEFARANTINNIEDTLANIFKEITRGDYSYANMHFSTLTKEQKVSRFMGNRALATNALSRNTANGKNYGRPTHTAINKLGSNLKDYYTHQSLVNTQPTYKGISDTIRK